MVKADNRRDYYGDLEVKPDADVSDIKKQFKKLALKYHPDRNPGNEVEFNARFQAIQSAHEVLTDTQQRAKYDADRIRAGLLHTYTSPMRPNMPPRTTATKWPPPPPPPRSQPPSATKPTFAPPPGPHRYTRHPRPEPVNTGNDAEAVKAAKVNAFKAWDQMRHGTGPPPQGRSMPARSPRTSTYQNSPPGSSGIPSDPPPKRPGWDQFPEPPSRFPGSARSRPGYDPNHLGADEPSVRYKSAYSAKGDHPPSRSRTTYMPPNQAHGTSPTKPDPLRAFRSQTGINDSFSGSARVSTPYATTGGEKTYFSSTGLGRSASSRESKEHGHWSDSDPNNVNHSHHQFPSDTSSRQHHSASPKTRSSMPRATSNSSSSSSSSDESMVGRGKNSEDSARKFRVPPRAPTQKPFGGHRRPSLKPTVQTENGIDDDMAPPRQPKQKPDESSYSTTSGYPEGFLSHRTKRESDRSQQQSPPNSTSPAQDPSMPPQRPLQRPRSWDDKPSSVNRNDNREDNPTPGTSDQVQNPSMYDSPGSAQSPNTPSLSNKWSDQWPFMSPKKPKTSSALPPYWAIPSSLVPRKQQEAQNPPYDPFHMFRSDQDKAQNFADITSFNSFKITGNDVNKPFTGTPPLRSHSSDTINLNFSPTDWNGKFTGNANEYFVPPPPSRANAPRGRTSPVRRQQLRPQAAESSGPIPEIANATAPPPSASIQSNPIGAAEQGNSSQEEWAKHLKPTTWEFLPPPPPGSPIRTSRKRPIAAKRPSKTANKRSAAPKAASISATLDDSGDENEAASTTTLSSKESNGGGSAMDIDPALTPPSAELPKTNGANIPPQAVQTDSTVCNPGPTLPPRSNGNTHAEPDTSNLNLGDLSNVAPFAPSQSGLGDLNDLSTTLPFESRPSLNPFNIHTPQPLILPSPPKSVTVPANLTQTSWERYLAQMRGYMFEWNAYNTKMLRHFNERQTSNETTMKPDWMSAIGEGNDKWGYKTYMQGIEEDFRVREHWDVSWERHRECMKGLGAMRESVLGSKTIKA